MARFDNILQTIGHTPLVRLNKLAPPGVNVYVKVEAFNPMGSVKDRMARAVIEAAEHSGELQPGQTVIEATSGNTGIGLAMVCAQKGYPLVVTMAENFSVERRKLMRFMGAKVVLTPASEKGTGMLAKAVELAGNHGYYLCRQFENEVNADVHSQTTAAEILEDFTGESLHYWVSGFGTGGTLKGVSRRLKQDSPQTRIVAVEPDNAQVLASGIVQARDAEGSPSASHPNFRPHLMQGWSPDFISHLTESAMDSQWVDEIVPVAGKEALRLSRELARREGIFVGISSGATLAGALQLAEGCEAGTNIVCMLPDTGERYMTTPLFEDIHEDMSEEELAISRSTPGCQFGESAPAARADVVAESGQAPVILDAEAARYVNQAVIEEPVVMFALEWCEFCWSVRKLFKALQLPYRSIDLDSVSFQKDNRGARIREVLVAERGVSTIPQIYIGGQAIGGATELFQAFEEGSLKARLDGLGIEYQPDARVCTTDLMPGWLHPRKSA